MSHSGNEAPTIRPIVLYGDPVLRETAKTIVRIDEEVRDLVADMTATLKDAQGLGLAANQVGALKRVFLVDLSPLAENEGADVLVFINPEILATEGEAEFEEGCLSIPGIFERVKRPARVKVRALNLSGSAFEVDADETLARVIQHEYDHLNGKLFIDHLSLLSRQLLRAKLRRIERRAD